MLLGIVAIGINGCMTASQYQQSLSSTQERKMTVGVVQKEIKKGMSQAKVAEILGSPNIVTKDKNGIETWIYDKIATEVSYSHSKTGGLLIGGIGFVGAGISGSQASGASSETQKTLTVIIKFKNGVVYYYTYHTSRF